MQVKIVNLCPNPFRNIDKYPIQRAKVEALKESINATYFWEVMIGRKRADGKIEIAYGHHRLIALKELSRTLGGSVDITVKKLDDAAMLKMMASENMQEWGHDVVIDLETVRAVVQAFADGKIQLGKPAGSKKQWRYAPGFRQGHIIETLPAQVPLPYTGQQISDFLGWKLKLTRETLQALEAIESKSLNESDLRGLGRMAAAAIVDQALAELRESERLAVAHEKQANAIEAKNPKRAKAHRASAAKTRSEAKRAAPKIAEKVSKAIKSGKKGYRQAGEIAAKHASAARKKEFSPELDAYAKATAQLIAGILRDGEIPKRLSRVYTHRDDLSQAAQKALVSNLDSLSKRAKKQADGFRFLDKSKANRLSA